MRLEKASPIAIFTFMASVQGAVKIFIYSIQNLIVLQSKRFL